MDAIAVTKKQALDDAMRDYVAEITDGAILTNYFLITASTELEDIGTGRTIYAFGSAEKQAPHISLGLLAYAQDNAQVVDGDDDD